MNMAESTYHPATGPRAGPRAGHTARPTGVLA